MPNYKMVDADALDGAMLETAKAIRAKGGTEELIAWNKSTGYKEAIDAITAGGGLNFTVVGGKVKPENPAENTVWVDTNQTITEWSVSFEKQYPPTLGDVWIELGLSDISFDIVDDNSIILEIVGVKQYANDTWNEQSAYLYKNGEWLNILSSTLTIFDGSWHYGYEFRQTTNQKGATISNNTNPVTMTMRQFAGAYIANIDFTNYDTLFIEIDAGANEWTLVAIADTTEWYENTHSTEITSWRFGGAISKQTKQFDVSAIDGKHNLLINSWGLGHNINIYSIKLERNRG